MSSETEGAVILHVDLTVYAHEIATWPGSRITQFFRGIAMAVAAKQGYQHVPGTEETYGSADRSPAP